jgi:DNA-binding transcriptional ArsR family regulator
MHTGFELNRARCARHLLDGGAEQMLENLHSSVRWRGSVLECDYPVDRHIDLAGRGLTVVPAHFCWGGPVTFIHLENLPILVVPTSADLTEPSPVDSTDEVVDRLRGLVGVTRARMLHELTIAGSTTEIAGRLGISPAAVSQHTRVLREAKLVVTTRFGTSVRHALTPLGTNLLRGK